VGRPPPHPDRDWRVLFRFVEPDVIVVRVKRRSEVYEV
jgi:hypothetical protein